MDETYMTGPRSAGRNTPSAPLPDNMPNMAANHTNPSVAPLPPIRSDRTVDPDFSVGGDIIIGPDQPIDPDFSAGGDVIIGPDQPIDPDFSVDDNIIIGPDQPIDPDFSVGDNIIVGPDRPIDPDFSVGGGVIILPGLINPRFATVRFLNAAAGYDALRITVGRRVAATGLTYGSLTGYGRVGDGFRTVTVARSRFPREILFQRNIPFTAGELVTLAVVRTNMGLDLVRVSDVPCRNLPSGRACIRAVNLCWNAPALDVLLNDGRMVFNDVRYKEVTGFRQAWPRDYGFYIAQTSFVPTPYFSDIETIEETPIVAPNYFLPGYGGVTPLNSFYINAKRNGVYTIYILGSWNYQSPDVRVRVVENFQ